MKRPVFVVAGPGRSASSYLTKTIINSLPINFFDKIKIKLGLQKKYQFSNTFQKNISVIKTHSLPKEFFNKQSNDKVIVLFLYGDIESTLHSIIKLWDGNQHEFVKNHLLNLGCKIEKKLNLTDVIQHVLEAYIKQIREWGSQNNTQNIYFLKASKIETAKNLLNNLGLHINLEFTPSKTSKAVSYKLQEQIRIGQLSELMSIAKTEYRNLSTRTEYSIE